MHPDGGSSGWNLIGVKAALGIGLQCKRIRGFISAATRGDDVTEANFNALERLAGVIADDGLRRSRRVRFRIHRIARGAARRAARTRRSWAHSRQLRPRRDAIRPAIS